MKNEVDDLNGIIVNIVLKNIPKDIKPVIYLMDLLDLSRESVYRRIRGDIPFTVDELATLALTLNLSLDEIIGGTKSERIFFDLGLRKKESPVDLIAAMLQDTNHYFELLAKSNNSNMLIALNCVYPIFTVYFPNLLKFNYLKRLVEIQNNLPKNYFSTLTLPQELLVSQQKLKDGIKNIGKMTFILSPNISLGVIKDIQYYYQRKLISKEDVEILKEDLLEMMDVAENIAKTGKLKEGKLQIDIYISIPYINSNTIYMEYDNNSEVHYWIYPNSPMIIRNSAISDIQKQWFLSMKKSSTLITQSNEILQVNFFDAQRKLINKLTDEPAENIYW